MSQRVGVEKFFSRLGYFRNKEIGSLTRSTASQGRL